MGIHGLTSFIDNNPHLLKDHQLHDCRVVIDGNNFYHFLYFYCNVRFQFGGDYDIFQHKISMIFSMFKECNIEAFVVFDGAYTVDGKKLKTTLGRARDRVYAAHRIMRGERGVLIPCLARQTFLQTLDQLGIQHVTCDFEADNQLVTLANLWNCPVISNDSDFYIFDLTGGFLPLDYIDFRPRPMREDQGSSQDDTAGPCLPVQFYHVDEFIKCFKSLKRSVLPLFATMLGNDYVNAQAFEAFYRKTPKIASRRYAASKKHHKIVSVLYWLEEKQHEGELVSEVLSFIRPERRQHVQKLLDMSISGYLDTQDFESFDLRAFLEGDREAGRQKTDVVTSATGETLPAWFVAACRCGEVPVFLLNAALLRVVMLPAQVESVLLAASFTMSKAIRQVIYGLLLGTQDPDPQCQHPPHQTALKPTPAGDATSLAQTSENNSGDKNGKLEGSKPSTDILEKSESKSDARSLAQTSGNTSGDKNSELEGSKPSSDILEKSGSESSATTSPVKRAESGVLEYTRHNLELRRIMVPPCVSLPLFGSLPSLDALPAVGQGERLAMLTEVLAASPAFVNKFHPSLQLYMVCLAFWAKNADPPVSHHLLKGIVLSAVLLHVHREIADREREMMEACIAENAGQLPEQQLSELSAQRNRTGDDGPTFSITDTCRSESDKALGKIRDNLKKYYQAPTKVSRKNPPVAETFHGTAQFLSCLLDAVHINSILRCPLSNPRPAHLFNGSFVYTIVHELQARSNPDLFLSQMLVKGSLLTPLFESLCSALVQEVGEGVFAERQSPGKKRCKGSKKRKQPQSAATCGNQTAAGEVPTDQDRASQAGFSDLNNPFGALQMDDDS